MTAFYNEIDKYEQVQPGVSAPDGHYHMQMRFRQVGAAQQRMQLRQARHGRGRLPALGGARP